MKEYAVRPRARRTIGLAVMLLAGTLALVGPQSLGASATNPWTLCLYRGSHQPEAVAAHEDWLGRDIPLVLEFVPYDRWWPIESPTNTIAQWVGTPYEILWTIPMLPSDGSTLAAGAAGQYDAKWQRFARTMIDNGLGSARVRLGHEFNHTWYPWTASGGREADYAAYYRRIVNVTRQAGASFRFTWSVLSGVGTANVERAYPGDAYVDVIGLDLYDSVPNVTDFDARWARLRSQPYGVDWLIGFAGAHGKPMSFDEWALTKSIDPNRRDPASDSGDNTVYIDRMMDLFATERVAYACYFDVETNYGASNSRIMYGPYPNASSRYRARLNGGASPYITTATSTSTSPPTTSTSTSTSTTTTTAAPSTTSTTAASTTSTTSWISSLTDLDDDEPSSPPTAVRDIAMVVGDAAKLPPKDAPTVERLTALGWEVRLVDDDSVTTQALGGAELVVLSSSVVPTKVPPWLADHAAPLLDLEAYSQTTLQMASGGRERADLTTVNVVDPSHPLAGGRRGTISVQGRVPMGVSTPAVGADIVATAATGEAAVYALEAGAMRADGAPAPARRAFVFTSYDSPPVLTQDGWALLDAAVRWLTA
jgi:hypothetical protein